MGVDNIKSAACEGIQLACGKRISHAVAAYLLSDGHAGIAHHREREIVLCAGIFRGNYGCLAKSVVDYFSVIKYRRCNSINNRRERVVHQADIQSVQFV